MTIEGVLMRAYLKPMTEVNQPFSRSFGNDRGLNDRF